MKKNYFVRHYCENCRLLNCTIDFKKSKYQFCSKAIKMQLNYNTGKISVRTIGRNKVEIAVFVQDNEETLKQILNPKL